MSKVKRRENPRRNSVARNLKMAKHLKIVKRLKTFWKILKIVKNVKTLEIWKWCRDVCFVRTFRHVIAGDEELAKQFAISDIFLAIPRGCI